MQLSRFLVATTLMAASVVSAGCSGTAPFGSQPSEAFSTAQGFDNPNRQPYEQLAQAFPTQNVVGPGGARMPVQPPLTNPRHHWWASLRGTGEAITEALTISPPTNPAVDPTSLANQPGDVGGALNYHAAKVYETDGNIAGAMALYQKALQMTPNDMRAIIGYARLLDREGNFREAEGLYRRALEIDPENVVAWNDLGMIYARQGMFAQALEGIGRAVELQPANQRYRNNIAILLIDMDRPDDAFGHLNAVHAEATAHYNVAYLLARKSRHEQAVEHLQQALTLNPQLAPARQLLGTLMPATGSPAQLAAPPVGTGAGPSTQAAMLPNSTSHRTLRPLPPL